MLNVQESIKFCSSIEIVVRTQRLSYVEAILEYIAKHQMEVEVVPKLLTPALKQKIENEAHELNMLGKKPQKLPFN